MSEPDPPPGSVRPDVGKISDAGPSPAGGAGRWAALGFAAVAIQFALLVLLLTRFNLETPAFQDVARIAFAGFLVHHFLPARWRLPFFLALSVMGTTYVLGLDQGQWRLGVSLSRAGPLFAVGLLLIGICHLPTRLGVRVVLLLAAGGVLAWLRSHPAASAPGALDAAWVWPVLGSMFMFRLMVYLHDLQFEKGPPQPARALSYFFLLPNVCFALFPVIDYKTFCRNYYNEFPLRIYQRGLAWMTRGIVQLLLWRIVYYEIYIDPSRVVDGPGLVRHLVSNMALYLRVSGQFHLVIGLLLLFGFNLPETNRRYFLAAGFTDYWRRVNIYWKDFIMKLFYYPAAFRLKAWGPSWSVVAATVFAFLVTWFLHSYQSFWVRNVFPVNWPDAIFWGSLCVLVMLNSLYEMRRGRKRSLGAVKVTWRDSARHGGLAAGTFFVLTVLWSLWTCGSLERWLGLWDAADAGALLWGVVCLAVIFAAAAIVEGPWHARGIKSPASARPLSLRRVVWTCMVPAALLLLVSGHRVRAQLGPGAAGFLGCLIETRLNESDEAAMTRGYYENLMDVHRVSPFLASAFSTAPRDWIALESTEVYRETDDYRLFELAPSRHIVMNGRPLSTNRWGMRDREYELTKAPGTYRIAFLGSSHVMGLNVADGEPFEALVEERLNRDRVGRPAARYEILNFGINRCNPPAEVVVLEKKVLDFKPDAVVLVVNPQDAGFAVQHFAKSLRKGIEPVDEVFREVARAARVDARTPELSGERRLMPYWPRLYEWAFGRIATRCRQEGIRPIVVYFPTVSGSGGFRKSTKQMMDLAREAGLSMINLEGVYGRTPPESLAAAPWDAHPNARGHRLIADRLFAELVAETGGLFGPSAAASSEPRGK